MCVRWNLERQCWAAVHLNHSSHVGLRAASALHSRTIHRPQRGADQGESTVHASTEARENVCAQSCANMVGATMVSSDVGWVLAFVRSTTRSLPAAKSTTSFGMAHRHRRLVVCSTPPGRRDSIRVFSDHSWLLGLDGLTATSSSQSSRSTVLISLFSLKWT